MIHWNKSICLKQGLKDHYKYNFQVIGEFTLVLSGTFISLTCKINFKI